MSGIQLDYAVPSSDIGDYVTLFYWFRADLAFLDDTERADYAQLRFRISPGGAEYRFPDDTVQQVPEIHVIGPTSGAKGVRVHGPVDVFGFGMTPGGWAAMIGEDASTMLNRVIDAASLFGAAPLRASMEALRKAPDMAARVLVGESLVRELIKAGDVGARRFVRQVDDWLAASPSPSIDDIIAVTGLSRRQIERKCKALYGAPPKLLARKYRALRAAVALMSQNAPLDDLLERGFYDQSHLIREIKHFTGLTPGQIKEEPSILSKLTIERRSALFGQISPLISTT